LILRYSAPDHSAGSSLHATLMIRIAIVDDYQNAAARRYVAHQHAERQQGADRHEIEA
jgi:hypothetical protein